MNDISLIPDLAENEGDPSSDGEKNEETVIEEGEHFHPSKDFKFPKSKQGTRERSCQKNWFNDFPWLHYDKR